MTAATAKRVDTASCGRSAPSFSVSRAEEPWKSSAEGGGLGRPHHEQTWNKYCTEGRTRKAFPAVSRPTKEESMKRRMWEEERRKYQEMQAKLLAARKSAEERKKEAAQEAKLSQRRSVILERTKRRQEKHAKFAKERADGEAQYRRLIENRQKLLHEKLYEEFAKVVHKPAKVYAGGLLCASLSFFVSKDAQKVESLKRRLYNERLGRFKTLRPKEIIDEGALTKFRVEVGTLSQTEARSKSTPCQRRGTIHEHKSLSSNMIQQRNKNDCELKDNRSTIVGKNNLSGGSAEVVDAQPQEEQELKKMLENQRKEEARLEAPPEVVNEDTS